MEEKCSVQKNFVLMFAVIGLGFTLLPVFAQEEVLSVNTSESTYEEGETVVISGEVTAIIWETPVTIQIFFESNLIEIAQLSVAQDGSYTHTVNAEGPLWGNDGDYTIRASYGVGNIAETTFEFVTEKALSETSNNFEVDAGSSGTFDVQYTIRGGTVENMIIDSDIFALIVIIDSEDDGNITLDLPRDSIDAKKASGSDDTYIILIDGIEVPYEEVSQNSVQRTLKIDFEEGDSDIEIIGTFVVPEFGTITILVLAIMTISVIILSRNKLQVMKSF